MNECRQTLTLKPAPVMSLSIGVGQGPAGPGISSARVEFLQSAPLAVWTVAHNLGYWPQVQCFSVGGREMIAEVHHTSINVSNIYFDDPVSGIATFD